MSDLLKSIENHEGFVGTVYKDSLGFETIGIGIKLPLTKFEARMILESRLNAMIEEIKQKEPFYNKLPEKVKDIISEMAYQLGVNGVLNFRKMWIALKLENYVKASEEGLDSLWHTQTPRRAEELMYRLKSIN